MSRSCIPGNKSGDFDFGYRQVCVYGFPRKGLRRFAEQQEKTPLEQEEDIEILRFLEMGFDVQMIELSGDSIAVDHPKDLDKNMPKIKEYSWHYYYGKRNVYKKFEKLLKGITISGRITPALI